MIWPASLFHFIQFLISLTTHVLIFPAELQLKCAQSLYTRSKSCDSSPVLWLLSANAHVITYAVREVSSCFLRAFKRFQTYYHPWAAHRSGRTMFEQAFHACCCCQFRKPIQLYFLHNTRRLKDKWNLILISAFKKRNIMMISDLRVYFSERWFFAHTG